MTEPDRDADLLRAATELAGLDLTDEQRAQLKESFAAAIADQLRLLAAVAPEQAPHIVFDPRWA